jgi:uncharacterized ParB-like nuclease family protein
MRYHPANPGGDAQALLAFRQARWRATVERARARLRGRPGDLLCYAEVHESLMPQGSQIIGYRQVPLSAIVGSVERCSDYSRGFLPLRDSDQSRWVSVKAAFSEARDLPAVHLYQVGDAYFVVDGNHRVSVAQQAGRTHIQAHVVQILTRVPLSPEDGMSDLRLKAEYARFLDRTALDDSSPQHSCL